MTNADSLRRLDKIARAKFGTVIVSGGVVRPKTPRALASIWRTAMQGAVLEGRERAKDAGRRTGVLARYESAVASWTRDTDTSGDDASMLDLTELARYWNAMFAMAHELDSLRVVASWSDLASEALDEALDEAGDAVVGVGDSLAGNFKMFMVAAGVVLVLLVVR
jgi:hypothetical protein